ncbi:MAG: hypothetical protein GY715_19565 [Planctomycetes bacterium]|nr:hypothetical protein [Planctomycetota bacterium]
MTQLQLCSKGAGFAVAVTACVGLTTSAFGDGTAQPPGTLITQVQIEATITVTGDTSNETNFLDSGTVALTDCGPGNAPDEWYQIVMTGPLSIDVELCGTGTTYDSKIFLMDTQGVVPAGCSDDNCGVTGGASALLNIPLTAGTYDLAIDGFGQDPGESGVYSAVIREFQGIECFLTPACTGTAEGEPCDETPGSDNVNGGCNSTPEAFGTVVMDGSAICGNCWGNGGTRDTDWYAFNVAALQGAKINLRAEADTGSFILAMSAGGACPATALVEGEFAYSNECDLESLPGTGFALDPGDYVLFVGTAGPDADPIFDGFPCPDGTATNNAYEVSLETAPIMLPCPWDLNENNSVDFADILQIIANWGPCPTI